ncbi:hypothetical protein [Mesonia mobilis]|uniref:hypothetical protein n=1 Tax=Mesonia mobilis TaxID=369791 RepID=UPI0026EEE966|nr:hypothetical protein [Mesonia mobilis]
MSRIIEFKIEVPKSDIKYLRYLLKTDTRFNWVYIHTKNHAHNLITVGLTYDTIDGTLPYIVEDAMFLQYRIDFHKKHNIC